MIRSHPFSKPKAARPGRGSALLVVLAGMTLVTALVVSLLAVAQFERTASGQALGRAKAEMLADYAADVAMQRIQQAILEGSQFATNAYTSWASEPGRIHLFRIDQETGEIRRTAHDLFSALPGDPDEKVNDRHYVDLNRADLKGLRPITGSRPGSMKIGWKNLLADPGLPASLENPIVGRIAYWVDDESCKVNLNTADGSQRATSPAQMYANQKFSFGFGTPSEISLAALLPNRSQGLAGTLAARPWLREFESIEDLLEVRDAAGNPVLDRVSLETLRFDVTTFNRSPDLNFLGEPRLQLGPTFYPNPTTPQRTMQLGPLTNPTASTKTFYGQTADFTYPQPAQLAQRPTAIPANRLMLHSVPGTTFNVAQFYNPGNYPQEYQFGALMTGFLNAKSPRGPGYGVNLRGETFKWPLFPGADRDAFAGKYTNRQLDSLVVQVLDITGKNVYADHYRAYTLPGIHLSGWLSGEPVIGIGRGPRLTEFLLDATASIGDPHGYGAATKQAGYSYPLIRFKLWSEVYFPEGFGITPYNDPFGGSSLVQWGLAYGGFNPYDLLNVKWGDWSWKVNDQNDAPAGVDLRGRSNKNADLDQLRAKSDHPYTRKWATDPNTGNILKNPDGSHLPATPESYSGSVVSPTTDTRNFPIHSWLLSLGNNSSSPVSSSDVVCATGTYRSTANRYTQDLPARPGVTEFRVEAGLQYWIENESGAFTDPTSGGWVAYSTAGAPFDAMVPIYRDKNIGTWDAATQEVVANGGIPLKFSVPVPGFTQCLARVADPLVNQLPGDWEILVDPPLSEITMQHSGSKHAYSKNGTGSLSELAQAPYQWTPGGTLQKPATFNGDNPGLRPFNPDAPKPFDQCGDPLLLWLPPQDIRIPKQARLPSVGALFALRTGTLPDWQQVIDATPLRQQKGVPFRALNLAPSTQSSQQTRGGKSYPDWAFLDLFNVPFLPQKPWIKSPADANPTVGPFRKLTHGGATTGRININNPVVPYPFSLPGVNQSHPPQRRALEALFFGLRPSNAYDASGNPVFTSIDAALSRELAEGVAEYQQANGPFFLAGEIANVPEVARYLYTKVAEEAISRNDLVRDTIGAITTRSNVYSVWVVAETIRKRPGNTAYGEFEPGDAVTAQVRRQYVVERSLEPGHDMVPGNAVNPAAANTPNAYLNSAALTEGEPANAAFHPKFNYPLPYRWRIAALRTLSY